MEKNMSRITDKILNLTLEIIYLLTGEVYVPKTQYGCDIAFSRGTHMSGEWNRGQSPLIVPFPSDVIPERFNEKKILEVIYKITELLMGEVPIRCEDVAVYFSMEEWQYLEGHKNLYKDAIYEYQSPLSSPDGSKNRKPLVRCASPLHSCNFIKEAHINTLDHQKVEEDVIVIKAKIKQEAEETSDNGSCKEEEILPQITTDAGDSSRVYQRATTAAEDIKKHVKVKEEEIAIEISTDGRYRRCSMDQCFIINTGGDIQDDITADSSEGNSMTPNLQPVCHSVLPFTHHAVQKRLEMSPCSVSDNYGKRGQKRNSDQKPDVRGKTYSCSECGKCFTHKSCLNHRRPRVVQKPYSCSECGRCFSQKSNLLRHQRFHTVVKPNLCSDCGRCFSQKSDLRRHQRTHTGEKPYSCLVCGRGFTQKSNLLRHHRSHSGEKPFSCSECGKCFTKKQDLVAHQIKHKK